MVITIAIFVAAVVGFVVGWLAFAQHAPAIRARARQQTLDMLINGRPLFQRIIAEMEARAAAKAERTE
jgi:hypothetical protein